MILPVIVGVMFVITVIIIIVGSISLSKIRARPGPAGLPGADGTNAIGLQGVNGLNGPTGPTGASGPETGGVSPEVMAAVVQVENATNTNTPSTLVKRDSGGNFSASTISADVVGDVTGSLVGNASTATNATSAVNFTASLSGEVTGSQTTTIVSSIGGQTSSNIVLGIQASNAATPNNTINTIIRRDGTGSFTAGVITASLVGNVTGNASTATLSTTATTATTATNFSNPLVGDVTGNQTSTIVSLVGTKTATEVKNSINLTQAATSTTTPNTLVLRDASSDFSTNKIILTGGPSSIINPNDATSKAYVDNAVTTGFIQHAPVRVVSVNPVASPPSTLLTIDGITLINGDRVLLVAQGDAKYNGIWTAAPGAWSRPADFANGSTVGNASVLVLEGTINAGSGWVSTTPLAVVNTDLIQFVQTSLPGQTTAANVGVGVGQLFRDKVGLTLNFKTLQNTDGHLIIINNANEVVLNTDATAANLASTIVSRDPSGNFSANVITATTLIGAASANVLKIGDTMTGNLVLAAQSSIHFQDLAGGEFVGLRAPGIVPVSYTIDLPTQAPTSGQVLSATSATTTVWATIGSSASEIIYVTIDGSDLNNGSFAAPFRTIAHAVIVANTLSTITTPISIHVGSGIFQENAITVTADFISIIGTSISSTIVTPVNGAFALITLTTANCSIHDVGFDGSNPYPSGSAATSSAIRLNTVLNGTTKVNNLKIVKFGIGLDLASTVGVPIADISNCISVSVGTFLSISNIRVVFRDSFILGEVTGITPTGTGINITGINSNVNISSASFRGLINGIILTGSAILDIVGSIFQVETFGLSCSGAATSEISGCNFSLNNSTSVCVSCNGAGTRVGLAGCEFACADATGTPQGTALVVTNGGVLQTAGCAIDLAVLGVSCGLNTDTSTTRLSLNSTPITNCTVDIQQFGTSTLRIAGGLFDTSKITINNAANVNISGLDELVASAMAVGTTSDVVQPIVEIINGQAILPTLTYEPNYYSFKGPVYINLNSNPTLSGTQAQNQDVAYYLVTGDRTKIASVNLISDTGTFGNPDNVRGWSIAKAATSAGLNFLYSNNDTSGQAARGLNAVTVFNGFDNQIEFPLSVISPLPTNTVARLVWATDTNLYRSSAALLKTDTNLAVGGLTPNRVVVTDLNDVLTSSATTSTELGNLSGVTSNIQTQLDAKVAKAGDTMTGALQLPAGSAAAPSLRFTGSTTTGLSVATVNQLSFDTAGVERMTISPTGLVTMTGALTLPSGSAAAPSLNFSSSLTTGLSVATVNQLSFDTNGIERMNISAVGAVTINGPASGILPSVSILGPTGTGTGTTLQLTSSTVAASGPALSIAGRTGSNTNNALTITSGGVSFGQGTATAAPNPVVTSAGTASATINAASGTVLINYTGTLSTNSATGTITINNNCVQTNSVIHLTILNYNKIVGTSINGCPSGFVTGITAGTSFTFVLCNPGNATGTGWSLQVMFTLT